MNEQEIEEWRRNWLFEYGKPEDDQDHKNVSEINEIFDLALSALRPAEPVAVVERVSDASIRWLDDSPIFVGMELFAAPPAESAEARDAARYRWLRRDEQECMDAFMNSEAELDAAIDAALAARSARGT